MTPSPGSLSYFSEMVSFLDSDNILLRIFGCFNNSHYSLDCFDVGKILRAPIQEKLIIVLRISNFKITKY